MTEEQVRQIIREELSGLLASDRFIFQKLIQMLDGRNIQTGLTTGTKIGTSVSQKIAFWGKTPIVQPASGSQAVLSLDSNVSGADTVSLADVNTNFASIQTLVNQMRTDLINVGIIKGSV
jgi:hypothetical protein